VSVTNGSVRHGAWGVLEVERQPECPMARDGGGEGAARALRRAMRALGLERFASEGDVRRRYKELVRKVHPDKGGDPDAFKDLQQAYALLVKSFAKDVSERKKTSRDRAASSTPSEKRGGSLRERNRVTSQCALKSGEDQKQLIVSSDLKELGDAALEEGAFETAIEYYDAALAYSKIDNLVSYADLLFSRSRAHSSAGNPSKALSDANRVAEMRPIWPQGLSLAGCLLADQGKWLQARETLKRAVRTLANAPAESQKLAEVQSALERTEAALQEQACLTVLEGHREKIRKVAFCPKPPSFVPSGAEERTSLLATCSDDGTARVWDIASGQCIRVFKGHTGPVVSLRWCPDGSGILATASVDGTAMLWNAAAEGAGMPVKPVATLQCHQEPLTDVVFDKYGGLVATTSEDCTACIWDVETGLVVHALPPHKKRVNTGRFSPLGMSFCTASDDTLAKVWDIAGQVEGAGECIHTLEWGEGLVNDVEYTPDGRFIVMVTRNPYHVNPYYRLLLWSAVSGRICRWFDGHTGVITSLSWHPCPEEEDDLVEMLATCSFDGTIKLWEITPEPTGAGSYLLECDDGQGQILPPWEKPTLGESLETEKVREGALHCLSYGTNGKCLASGGLDGHVRIYDSETLDCVHDWTGHAGAITDLCWSVDGSTLVTTSDDKTARVWQTAPAGAPRNHKH